MSLAILVAFSVVGIVASLTLIITAIRTESPIFWLAGLLCLGFNVFTLVNNIGGAS